MKNVNLLKIAILALMFFGIEKSIAGSYRIYCNTVARFTATTPNWNNNQILSKNMSTIGYSLIRDADFGGSDFKQVYKDVETATVPDAGNAAMNTLCVPESKLLLNVLYGLKIPLTANISQCTYVFEGATLKANVCKFLGAIKVE